MSDIGALICLDCGQILTDDERHYYEVRCEGCERDAHEEVQRWKAGEPNERLDNMFSVERTTH